MPESLIHYPEKVSPILERMNWYQVNHLLQNLGQTAEEMQVRPQDIVHIGGVSMFYRLYEVYGKLAVSLFRGTTDMDVVSFRQGTMEQMLQRMQNVPGSLIKSLKIDISHGLPDKKTFMVEFNETNDPALDNKFKIDVYESPHNRIKFNNRFFGLSQIVLDPPVQLVLPARRGLVVIPSMRDSFTIKMDIIDSSESGLRAKDQLDVFTYLFLCSKGNVSFKSLLDAVAVTSAEESAIHKMNELEKLLLDPLGGLVIPGDYPFIPARLTVQEAIKDVRRTRDKVNKSGYSVQEEKE